MILTVDLGTSATKVVVWDDTGPVAVGRGDLVTVAGPGGRAEQDPDSWWTSVLAAAAAVGARAPGAVGAVEAVGFAAARQTFVPVDDAMQALGPALVWSDRRAGAEAEALAASAGGPGALHRLTGVVPDGGWVGAKLAWMERHEPGRLRAARWLLSPRDLILWRLTGVVATDVTLASATGLYDASGRLVDGLAGDAAGRLPDPLDPVTVAGNLRADAARPLGLRPGLPVVVGCGDRPAEVLGTGADPCRPMASWGTTANVSLPVRERPDPPPGLVVSRGALGGWLLEGGLSAAGSLLDWLARLTGTGAEELWERAAAVPPGARGVLALPWLGGARAPWWSGTARAAWTGLAPEHGSAEMARAAVEGVARDLDRCLAEAWAAAPRPGPAPDGADGPSGLALAGGGATRAAWVEALTGTTGLVATRRRSAEAASAGAALVASAALGAGLVLDGINPLEEEIRPPAATVARYRDRRAADDAAARAVLGLPGAPEPARVDRADSGVRD